MHARMVRDTREAGVVPIQAGGRQTAVFFLHGQYDDAGFYCYRLAQALGPDRPFYAVEPYRLDGTARPPAFEDIAAAHLKSVRAVQPLGPYVLGGWCNGALLAYEMARQLAADGQHVEQLLLLDSVYRRYPAWLRFGRGAIRAVGRSVGAGEDAQLEAYLRFRHAYRSARHRLAYARSAGYRRTATAGLERDDYPGIYDWTAMAYSAPRVVQAGRTTFIWSVNRPSLIHGFRVSRFRRTWRDAESDLGVQVRELPYTHWTLLSENLDSLARLLRETL